MQIFGHGLGGRNAIACSPMYSVNCTSKLGALWAPNFGGSARALVCSFLLVTTFINGNIGKVHIYLIS